MGSIQCADAEHEPNAHFLFPMQLQLDHLRHWEANHPEIQRDAHGGICPGQSVHVDASATVFSVPFLPVVGDGPALECPGKDKDDTVYNVENDRTPE